MIPLRHARVAAVLAMALATACGEAPREPQALPATGYLDTRRVPPGNEAMHADLPGIDGFDALEPHLQQQVVQRANSAACTCGCVGHAVNDCLHQHEDCEVALRLAGGFVDDALAFQHQAGGDVAATPAPGEGPSAQTGVGTVEPGEDEP